MSWESREASLEEVLPTSSQEGGEEFSWEGVWVEALGRLLLV